jgi:hypothetical protein
VIERKGQRYIQVISGRMLRKISIRLSFSTNESWTTYMKMNLFELAEFIDDLKEVSPEK